MREQNHKIASMLSLVSTLAEDMNGVKMGLNHFAMIGGHNPNVFIQENLGNNGSNKLIEVSDDEGSEEDEEEKSEDEGSEEKSEDEGSDDGMYDDSDSSEDEEGENDDIKIIKLQVSNEDAEDDHSYEEADNLHFENHEDLNEELDLDEFNMNDEIPEIANDYVEEILSLKYDETPTENTHLELEESKIPSTSELKTISINLGDDVHNETIDYKKLQLPKLRSIVVEKGLATNVEASKLKKPELLKLLGAE
jgi:hypothetical protein